MAMPEVIVDPDKTQAESPLAAQIDLAKLDDKRLGQYRHPNERRALFAIAVGMVAILAGLTIAQSFLGNLLSYLPNPMMRALIDLLHPARIGPLLLLGLVLMWLMDVVGQWSRAWQLVAQAVEVTPTTFPQLAPIVDDLRKRFDMPRTRVYVSRDAPPKGYTIGVREPFAVVFSSVSVASLTPDEFKFTLGREMGSIKLGHTQMATLLGNARMSLPQPFSILLKFRSILFSTYHHAQELSCDRIGVVATRDVRPALSTLVKQNIGTVRGAKIDVTSLSSQSQEMERGVTGKALRASMHLNSQPSAVARLYELVKWAGEPAPAAASAPAAPAPPTPAASAAAAAASAAAAAASAAEAAASAAAAAASAAAAAGSASPLAPSGAGTCLPPITTAAGPSQADAPATSTTPVSPKAEAAAPTDSGTAAEKSPAKEAVATPAPTSESTGTGAPTPPPAAASEDGSVSVTAPRPPHEERRDLGGSL
jgi:hypothetical protein